MIAVALVAALIVLNGLFVAAEFAIIGVPRTLIEQRAARGERLARLVRRVLDDPRRQDQYIATAQLGITFASLGLGMYGEHVLAQWIAARLEVLGAARWVAAHGAASALAVGILTYLHIVAGEMVPKSLALLHAERTAMWISGPMEAIRVILFPLVVGLNGVANVMLAVAGIRRRIETASVYTPEELELIVLESEEGGLLPRQTAEVVRDLLAFGDLTAGDVMAPRVTVVGLPIDASPAELSVLVRQAPHTRYPLIDGDLDHIVGVVHVKDLLEQLRRGAPLQVESGREVPFVPETATLDAVLAAMNAAATQMAVVLDEHGGTAGIVTIEDLFEEIVGEVEEGKARPVIYRDAAGRLRASGIVRLDEVGQALGREIEHPEVDTVSGLVLARLGRPPVVGDVVEFGGVRFQVTAVSGRGVRESAIDSRTDADQPAGTAETDRSR